MDEFSMVFAGFMTHCVLQNYNACLVMGKVIENLLVFALYRRRLSLSKG